MPHHPCCAALALVASLVVSAPAAARPSFDCAKAKTSIEKSICKDPQLSDLDATLAKLFSQKLAQDQQARAPLLAAQRRWLHERDRRCALQHGQAACLIAMYRQRIAALNAARLSPERDRRLALCRTFVASYKKLVAADPTAPYGKGFYAQSPLDTLASNAGASGVSVAPAIQLGADPHHGLEDWAARQKPPLILTPALKKMLASHPILDHLPGTHLYAASTIEGTMECYDSIAFEVVGGQVRPAQKPSGWDDENGAGCLVSRAFGAINATPVAFQEAYDYSPAMTSSLAINGWRGDHFGPTCSITFHFAPRFAPQGTVNTWTQSCTAPDCNGLRQAALALVETVQAGPQLANSTLLAKLTQPQRADFQAIKKDARALQLQKIPQDPGDLTDRSPLILPLIVQGRLYLARVGHFTIGWRGFSDWSVKIDQRDGKAIKEIAAFALGMTRGKLLGADVK